MKVASFDVFDTALIRLCGSPECVFQLLARRLWPDDEMLRTAFLNHRRQAAVKAGINATLSDIYQQFGKDEFLPFTRKSLMEAEMAMESELLTANPIVRDEINKRRSEGWTVKFVSDMYLSSDFLRSVLKREGCLQDDEEVIVSCEWGARKDDGGLYRKIREKYEPEAWVHYGDNKNSDIKQARRAGVKVRSLDVRKLVSYTAVEQRILSHAGEFRNGWQLQLMVGLMRAERLKHGNTAMAILASDYVAALYVPFVAWVLREAKRKGIERLHFLSRDGYIMQQIAEHLDHDGIELNYLFVSRKALQWGYLAQDAKERFLRITDRQHLLMRTVDSLLAKLNLTREELSKHGVAFDYAKINTVRQQEDFLTKVFDTPGVASVISEEADNKSPLVMGYLRQEGLTEDKRQAMVDIGWLGTTRLMINDMLGVNIPTFYVGGRADIYPRSYGDFYTYFPVGALDTMATALIEEYYSASPWPSTIGYRVGKEGEIEPDFGEGSRFEATEIVKMNVACCEGIADGMRPWLKEIDDEVMYYLARMVTKSIASTEDKVDLRPLLESPTIDGVAVVKRLSLSEVIDIAILGNHHTAYERGSLALTTTPGMSRKLWRMHNYSGRLRGILYRRIMSKR